MKIGVVAYEMEGARTGVGRYLEGLLEGLTRCARDGHGRGWTWRLFFKGDPFEHPLWSDADGHGFEIEPVFDRRPRARPILWEQLRLPRLLRRAGVDLVFSPGYSLPPGPIPSLVTVHDLSFEHLPEEFPLKERWRRRLLARRAVRQARRVLTDTRRIATDLVDTYDLDPGKIGVVPLALDGGVLARRALSVEDDPQVLDAQGVRRPYLLYLGSILERRQIGRMIEAFSVLAGEDRSLTLVIAGRNRLRKPQKLERWIARSGAADRIVHRGYVPEAAIGPLYRQAELSLYLSSYEGYGLPPLESLASGTPAVVAPGLALDDLWPDYPYRCESLDLESVVETLRKVLDSSDRRREIGREAHRRFAKLTWQRSAEQLLAEIELAIS
ncbi:MAG: glycosyltransferase family 1 protein [Thermoanaerobaculia bacterium]